MNIYMGKIFKNSGQQPIQETGSMQHKKQVRGITSTMFQKSKGI